MSVFEILMLVDRTTKENELILTPLLNQGDSSIYGQDIYSKSIFYETNSYSILNNPEIWLIEVDLETDTVLGFVKKYDYDSILNDKLLEKIKSKNLKISKTKNQSKLSKVEIPDDLYIDQTTWDFLIASISLGEYPLLIGPKGTGKTSVSYAIAKALDYEIYPINCGTLFKPKTALVGSIQAKNGDTFLVPSEFLNFYTSDKKVIIFLNELSRIPTGASNYMMTILDKIQSYIYVEEEGKRYYKGENVLFIADANFGSEYTDTRSIDGAFIDRFVRFSINYLDEIQEIELINNRIGSFEYKKDVEQLVKYANLCRAEIETLQVGVSTRQLISMAKYFTKGFSIQDIVENIFKNIFVNGDQTDTETISKIFDSIS